MSRSPGTAAAGGGRAAGDAGNVVSDLPATEAEHAMVVSTAASEATGHGRPETDQLAMAPAETRGSCTAPAGVPDRPTEPACQTRQIRWAREGLTSAASRR